MREKYLSSFAASLAKIYSDSTGKSRTDVCFVTLQVSGRSLMNIKQLLQNFLRVGAPEAIRWSEVEMPVNLRVNSLELTRYISTFTRLFQYNNAGFSQNCDR